MARRMEKFQSVNAILPKLFHKLGIKKQYSGHLISFYWEKIVGPGIAEHIHPVNVSFDTLFLSAESPVWANQLMLMQMDILKKINSFIGESCIKEIRFCTSKRKKIELELEQPEKSLGRALKHVKLSEAEKKKAVLVCSAAENEKLRSILERIYGKQLRLEKLEKKNEWHRCKCCSVFCPKDKMYCTACERKLRQEKEEKIRSILMEIPWARYSDVHQYVDCSPEMVNTQRVRIMQKIAANVAWGDTESIAAKSLVMLYRSIPPEQLTEEKVKRALYSLRNDLHHTKEFKPKKRYDVLKKNAVKNHEGA